ncbi:hypothetical protein [Ruminiclostridium cellobioparum]|uniref:Uncharacterized protein n=1 Tax=Ruminiclostridium cellobioparum subsp. termitidis CT1112 TaxID=1195236 RepID=S0FPR0_RUMCE|nr:hypothetical protein [Ruminiclostridium cellobioparum]EMS70473.1 hypothetical protein CTER_3817 [Ruminiclostridium cellobioparum subsp. termitidis CT1112]
MVKSSKKYKIVALILALVLITTTIPLTILGIDNLKPDTITVDNASSEDKRIASEISNETGVSIEEVFELKAYGRSWNEVLTFLRNKSTMGESSNKNKRDDLLLNAGLDEEYMKKLKKEGFTEDEISEAKLIEERVIFQLEEITSKTEANQLNSSGTAGLPNPSGPSVNAINQPNQADTGKLAFDVGNTDSNADIIMYQKLYEKIDIKNAIYFMLKLKADFGSCEKAFDEYLFSLQADIDLNDYIKDKEAYLKSRDEKKLLLDDRNVITLEKIEAKSIEKIQTEDRDSDLISDQNQAADKSLSEAAPKETSPLPDVPKPNSVDVKPKNPTDEIMNEINGINPIENQK